MVDEVKPPKRKYNSTRRRQQARETRSKILEASRRLFLRRGYTGTTLDSIASEAGVAVETVYAAFRNKRTILATLFDISVVGDDRPVPLLARTGPQTVRRETDQVVQIHLFAHGIREIMERVGPLFEVMRLAAPGEPEIAGLLQNLLGQRLEGMRFLVDALTSNGPLRSGLDLPRAIDEIWTLSSPEVHRLLTVDREWSGDAYETWLADTLTAVLLPGERDGAL